MTCFRLSKGATQLRKDGTKWTIRRHWQHAKSYGVSYKMSNIPTWWNFTDQYLRREHTDIQYEASALKYVSLEGRVPARAKVIYTWYVYNQPTVSDPVFDTVFDTEHSRGENIFVRFTAADGLTAHGGGKLGCYYSDVLVMGFKCVRVGFNDILYFLLCFCTFTETTFFSIYSTNILVLSYVERS